MNRGPRIPLSILALMALVVGIVSTLYLQPPRPPPLLAIDVVGYTNRTGPFAILAITNSTDFPMTLSAQCRVNYSPVIGPRQPQSIEANPTASVQLLPKQGFIQEVFVFPSEETVWQFEISAAYSSRWLSFRHSVENLLQRCAPSIGFPLTSRAYRRSSTDWLPAPP